MYRDEARRGGRIAAAEALREAGAPAGQRSRVDGERRATRAGEPLHNEPMAATPEMTVDALRACV